MPAFSLKNRNKSILERKYIDKVLNEEGANIINEQIRLDSEFLIESKRVGHGRKFSVSNNILTLRHSKLQRFFDMRKLNGMRQKSSRQHNAVVWGHFANIQNKVKYGFTQSAIEAIKNEIKIEING